MDDVMCPLIISLYYMYNFHDQDEQMKQEKILTGPASVAQSL